MMGAQSGLAAYLLLPVFLLIAIAQAQVQCQGKDDLSTFTVEGVEYEVHCNTDLQVGNIIDTEDATFEDCAAACERQTAENPDVPCVAGVLNSESSGDIRCNLKAAIENEVESDDFDSIFRLGPVTTDECFGKANGTVFTEGGLLYEVYCNYDVFEFDEPGSGISEEPTFEACAARCNDNPNCLAVVVEGQDDGTVFCHVKESVANQGDSDQYSVAFLISPRVVSTTSSATGTVGPTGSSAGTSVTAGSTSSSVIFPNSTTLSVSSSTVSIPGSVTSTSSVSSSVSLSTSLPGSVSSVSVPSSVTSASFTNSSTVVSSTESSISVSGSVTSLSTSSVGTSVSVTSSPAGSVSPSGSASLSSSAIFTNSSSVTGTVTSETGVSTTGTAPASTTSASGPSPFFAIRVTLTIGIDLYVSGNGTLVADVSLAASFEIVSGELFQIVGGQRVLRRALGGQIKVQPGVDRLLFAPSTVDSGVFITTLFIFPGFGNVLPWDNSAFFDGRAGYCVIDGALYATFEEDTSFCDQIAAAVVVPVPTATGSATSALATPTSGSTTIINNYNNTTIYNNIEYNFNINIDINIFAGGNYAPADGDFFYAILCPVCPPVKVCKSDLTYAQAPCPVCKPEIHKLKSASHPKVAGPTTCEYGPSTCVSCEAPKAHLAVVPAPCPVCPDKTTYLVCPTEAASSVKEVASSKGPEAAASAAKSAITLTVTKTVAPAKASEVAPSTVANVPCESCPAGSVAVTLPQVAATGAPEQKAGAPAASPEEKAGAPAVSPEEKVGAPVEQPAAPAAQPSAPKVQPSGGLTPPIADFKGAASLSAPITTGFALMAAFVGMIVYL